MTTTYGFTDDDTLAAYVKDHLQKSESEQLKPYWGRIILQALKAAYNEIVGSLVNRGYLKSDIDQWDRGEEFQLDIGCWWALKRLAVLRSDILGQQNLDALDRRPELQGKSPDTRPVVVTINGVPAPSDQEWGTSHYGAFDTTHDMFVAADIDDDSRIGDVTVL